MDPLITSGDLEAYLQRAVDAAPATLACQAASGAVRAHCGWDISYAPAATLYAAGADSTVVGLPTLHLLDVTEVRVDGQAADPAVYRWTRRGQLYSGATTTIWSRWSRIEVDCSHGYDPVPDVVKLVALSIAARHYTNPEGVQWSAVGSVSRTFNVTPLDASLLDAYRLP